MFNEYLTRWGLTPDGDAIATASSSLLPVRRNGTRAMLKIALTDDEKIGGRLMAWWDGHGAAKVLAAMDDAILLKRACCNVGLADLARCGRDEEAPNIICQAVATLHKPRPKSPPKLPALSQWFDDLEQAAAAHGGSFRLAAGVARNLMADVREPTVLHGDIHHGNILDFGEAGWLAIDPKGVFGERAFDYANLFCNPDLSDPSVSVATIPARFERRLEIVCAAAGLDQRNLLQWILAWSGLSATWSVSDGRSPEIALRVGALAAAALGL